MFNLLAGVVLAAEAHDHFGYIASQKRDLDEAIAQYKKTLQLKSDDLEAHLDLGTALLGTGNFDEQSLNSKRRWSSSPALWPR